MRILWKMAFIAGLSGAPPGASRPKSPSSPGTSSGEPAFGPHQSSPEPALA
jgi:hypothetical protein